MPETRVLLAYHSSEGQTQKIAERVAERLRGGGIDVELTVVEDAPAPGDFDGVVVGDSIHAGRHSGELGRYLSHHIDQLRELPVAVFQVSLTSASEDDEHTSEAHRLLHGLLEATGLDPDVVGLFAGALRYTIYGWLKRRLMRKIVVREGGDDTDITRDYEYTDWDAVDAFAADVLALFDSSMEGPGGG